MGAMNLNRVKVVRRKIDENESTRRSAEPQTVVIQGIRTRTDSTPLCIHEHATYRINPGSMNVPVIG